MSGPRSLITFARADITFGSESFVWGDVWEGVFGEAFFVSVAPPHAGIVTA